MKDPLAFVRYREPCDLFGVPSFEGDKVRDQDRIVFGEGAGVIPEPCDLVGLILPGAIEIPDTFDRKGTAFDVEASLNRRPRDEGQADELSPSCTDGSTLKAEAFELPFKADVEAELLELDLEDACVAI